MKARIQSKIKKYATVSQIKHINGKYSEIEYIRTNSLNQHLSKNHQILIGNGEEWNKLLKKYNSLLAKKTMNELKENKEQF